MVSPEHNSEDAGCRNRKRESGGVRWSRKTCGVLVAVAAVGWVRKEQFEPVSQPSGAKTICTRLWQLIFKVATASSRSERDGLVSLAGPYGHEEHWVLEHYENVVCHILNELEGHTPAPCAVPPPPTHTHTFRPGPVMGMGTHRFARR